MEELMASYLADELDEKERANFESQLIYITGSFMISVSTVLYLK